MGFAFMVPFAAALWNQVDRDDRDVFRMLSHRSLSRTETGRLKNVAEDDELIPTIADAARYPTVDIVIVCYSEPVDIIEPTVVAALNTHWAPGRLSVLVCDDGGRADVRDMVESLQQQQR